MPPERPGRALANGARTIRVPVHVVERRRKVLAAARRLETALGRSPTKEELAAATDLTVNQIEEALSATEASVSLNQDLGSDDHNELGDLPADPHARDPYGEREETLRSDTLRRALEALPPRERRILELHFGHDADPWTLDVIARDIRLTRERVRQIEGQALARLATVVRARGG